MATPKWILDEAFRPLTPPPDVMALGKVRSAENLLAASESLHVKEAKRYQPTQVTFCNIYTSDVLDILGAPIPHWWKGPSGAMLVELRANDMFDRLQKKEFPGWEQVSSELEAANRATLGLPTIAIWRNIDGHPGHVMLVVPSLGGKAGCYVTGAGASCNERIPLLKGFGLKAKPILFWGHD